MAEAYLRGLERLVASGGDPSGVHSVASFFVSRVDTEADRRLAEVGRNDLKARLGVANAKLAYQQYKALFHGKLIIGAGQTPLMPASPASANDGRPVGAIPDEVVMAPRKRGRTSSGEWS